MKEFLSRAGVPYQIKNIETDLDAYRELLARGFLSVPVTFIGDDLAIRGFDETALRAALT